MLKIGYMGIAGSFSDAAAHEIVKKEGYTEVEYFPLVCSKNILDKLREGEIDLGVLGVVNTIAGPVSEFVEAFSDVEYEVLSEYVLPIHHCLYKLNGEVPEEKLTTVASHQHALVQTNETRKKRWPALKELEVDDTALGAQYLAEGVLPDTTAVICSLAAGEMFGLDLIAENIEDNPANKTTFKLLRLI